MRARGRRIGALACAALVAAGALAPAIAQSDPNAPPAPPPPVTQPSPASPAEAAPAAAAPTPATPAAGTKELRPLGTSGQVGGTVLTPARQPVRGASVALLPDKGGSLYGTSTGEDGRYSMQNLVSDTFAVLVMDPGGRILRKERVNVRPLFRNIVDFTSEPVGSPKEHVPSVAPSSSGVGAASIEVSGALTTNDERAIPEAWVVLAPMGSDAPSMRARTDAEGRFRLVSVPAGYYRISARSLGHITWSMGPLLLQGGHDLSLRVTMLPFPLGHPQNPEDLIVPVDPVPPEAFEAQPPS